MQIEFDREAHRYSVGGVDYPSVSKIIEILYDFSMVKDDVLALAAERGSAVHYATELYDENDLDWSGLDDRIVNYVRAWERFRTETGWHVVHKEQVVAHPVHRYAGTFDRIMAVGQRRILVDIKTASQLHPATAIQTAAYVAAYSALHNPPTALERAAVKLNKDGTYRLQMYTDKSDFGVFLGCLNIYRFKQRNHP